MRLPLQTPGNNYRRNSVHTIPLTQKLLLILGKPGFRLNAGYKPITVPPLKDGTGREPLNPWLIAGMEMIIERFTLPHQTLADPIMVGEASVRTGWTEPGPVIHRGVGRPGLYRQSSCPAGSSFRQRPDLNQNRAIMRIRRKWGLARKSRGVITPLVAARSGTVPAPSLQLTSKAMKHLTRC